MPGSVGLWFRIVSVIAAMVAIAAIIFFGSRQTRPTPLPLPHSGKTEHLKSYPALPGQGGPPAVQREVATAGTPTLGSYLSGSTIDADSGRPLAAVEVAILSSQGGAIDSTISDDNGEFGFTIRHQWHRVVGRKDGFGLGQVFFTDPSSLHVTIAMPPASVIQGRVVMPSGAVPPRPLDVIAWDVDDPPPSRTRRQDSSQSRPWLQQTTKTDADGSFTISVAPSRSYRIEVSAPGLCLLHADGDREGRYWNNTAASVVRAGDTGVVLHAAYIYVLAVECVEEDGTPLTQSQARGTNPLDILAYPNTTLVLCSPMSSCVRESIGWDKSMESTRSRLTSVFLTQEDTGERVGPFTVVGSVPGYSPTSVQAWAVRGDLYEVPTQAVVRRLGGFGGLRVFIEYENTAWWESVPVSLTNSAVRIVSIRLSPESSASSESVVIPVYALAEPAVYTAIPEGSYSLQPLAGIPDSVDISPQQVTIYDGALTDIGLKIGTIGGIAIDARVSRSDIDVECTNDMTVWLEDASGSWEINPMTGPPYTMLAVSPGLYKLHCEYGTSEVSVSSVVVRPSELSQVSVVFR